MPSNGGKKRSTSATRQKPPGYHPGRGTPHMDSTEISSGQWTEMCRQAFAANGGDLHGFMQSICAQLAQTLNDTNSSSVAQAFVEGACELARYAALDLKEGENAIDAER